MQEEYKRFFNMNNLHFPESFYHLPDCLPVVPITSSTAKLIFVRPIEVLNTELMTSFNNSQFSMNQMNQMNQINFNNQMNQNSQMNQNNNPMTQLITQPTIANIEIPQNPNAFKAIKMDEEELGISEINNDGMPQIRFTELEAPVEEMVYTNPVNGDKYKHITKDQFKQILIETFIDKKDLLRRQDQIEKDKNDLLNGNNIHQMNNNNNQFEKPNGLAASAAGLMNVSSSMKVNQKPMSQSCVNSNNMNNKPISSPSTMNSNNTNKFATNTLKGSKMNGMSSTTSTITVNKIQKPGVVNSTSIKQPTSMMSSTKAPIAPKLMSSSKPMMSPSKQPQKTNSMYQVGQSPKKPYGMLSKTTSATKMNNEPQKLYQNHSQMISPSKSPMIKPGTKTVNSQLKAPLSHQLKSKPTQLTLTEKYHNATAENNHMLTPFPETKTTTSFKAASSSSMKKMPSTPVEVRQNEMESYPISDYYDSDEEKRMINRKNKKQLQQPWTKPGNLTPIVDRNGAIDPRTIFDCAQIVIPPEKEHEFTGNNSQSQMRRNKSMNWK